MPAFCASYGCSTRRGVESRRRGITFHLFPKAGERRRRWELALRRDGFVATGTTLLCSDHFTSEQFDRTGQTVRLKDGVVPTIFNFPAHLQMPVATRSTTTSRRAKDNLPMDLSQDEPQPDVPVATRSTTTSRRAKDNLPMDLSQDEPQPDVCLVTAMAMDETAASRTFDCETRLIVLIAVRSVVGVITESLGNNTAKKLKTQFSRVIDAMVREAVPKISRVFRELYSTVLKENQALRDKLGQLEQQLKTTALHNVSAASGMTPTLFIMQQPGQVVPNNQVPLANTSQVNQAALPMFLLQSATSQTILKAPGSMLATSQVLPKSHVVLMDGGHVIPNLIGLPVATRQASSAPQETVKISEGKLLAEAETNGGTGLTEDQEERNRRRREKYNQKLVFCDVCKKGFHYARNLNTHMKLHNKPFSCNRCEKKFHQEAALEKHVLTHEAKENRAQMRALRSHELLRTDVKPFTCETCGRGFTMKTSLKLHRSIHTGEKNFKCATCGKTFRARVNLRSHKRVHSDQRPFKCAECPKAFKSKVALGKHTVVHTQEKAFICQLCGSRFGLQGNLQRHVRNSHTGEKPLSCRVCGERFTGDWALKSHMLTHGATKPFMCDLCGKTFFYNSMLLKHQKLVHCDTKEQEPGAQGLRRRRGGGTPAKPFNCKVCMKGFCTPTYLKIHEKSHQEHKEFNCDLCGKSFHVKNTFDYHMKNHTGEKPYGCGVCGKKFILWPHLKNHEMIHTGEKPYKCEECGKAFRTSCNFYRHLRVHTGAKPYGCKVCGRWFSQSNTLKSHMQIHTGVKLYSCDHCGTGFSESRQLKKHDCSKSYQNSFGATTTTKRRRQKV